MSPLLDARIAEESDYGGVADYAGYLTAARRFVSSLREALRSEHGRATPLIPAHARTALRAFNIIRYSASGDLTAAISLSQYADPTGEVSGGYWLHLSSDHGKTWRPPLYLGLEEYLPYVLVPRSKLPLVRGRVLQVEVEVRELDLASIVFPPIGLSTRRSGKDLYIELSLDDIERDTDGDGLPDLLEEKLGTDPNDADTDHDGLRDDVDSLPQSSRTAPPIADAEVVRMTLYARTQAVVIWNAGWTGGTLRFRKAEGHWLPPARDEWIT